MKEPLPTDITIAYSNILRVQKRFLWTDKLDIAEQLAPKEQAKHEVISPDELGCVMDIGRHVIAGVLAKNMQVIMARMCTDAHMTRATQCVFTPEGYERLTESTNDSSGIQPWVQEYWRIIEDGGYTPGIWSASGKQLGGTWLMAGQ